MARVVLPRVKPTMTGAAISLTAATVDGDAVPPGSALWVKNGSGASINVTVVTPGTINGLGIDDVVIAVPAGAERLIGAFNEKVYRQTAGTTKRLVHVNYSAFASVTRAVIGLT